MTELVVASIIFGYFLVGVIAAGLTKRISGDAPLAGPMVVVWPVFGPMMLLMLLYLWIAGELD